VEPILEVVGVSKAYNSKSGSILALSDITFSAIAGEFVAIVGPSGCGKSTLLKIMGDLLAPSSGYIRVSNGSAEKARLQGKFSYVFQNPVLLPWRRVIDNVNLPLEVLKHRSAGRSNPLELLEKVGIKNSANFYPSQLSGGMQQRVALARALTFNPDLLMMDEPFGAVDELTRDILNMELINVWSEIRVTVFLVTHSITEAVFLADRIIVLSQSPGTIRRIFNVGFGRPRDASFRDTPAFQEFVKCVRCELG
jgi:NitT/TauT family transport system ATP-binding protein